MSRRVRYILIILSSLLLLCAALALALPTLAARGLESKLNGILDGRQQDARWASLEVDWSGALDVRDLEVSDPERGVTLVAERVLVKPTLGSLFDGEPKLREVRLVGAMLVVDSDTLQRSLQGAGDKDEEKKSDKPKDPNSMAEKFKRSLKEEPPTIRFERVGLKVRRAGKDLFTFDTDEGLIEQRGEELAIEANGDAAIVWEKLPKLMHQARPWGVAAKIGLNKRTAKLALTSGNDAAPLVDLVLPRVGYIKIGELRLDLDLSSEDRKGLVELDRFNAKVGDVDELIASLQAEALSLDVFEERPRVVADGVALEVTPAKLSEIQRLGKRLKPSAIFKKRKETEPPEVGWEKVLARLNDYGLKANAAMMRVDAKVSNASLAIHLLEDDDRSRRIELVNGLTATLERGSLEASGASSGGTFAAMAVFAPGQAMPTTASLLARNVDISKLPGMEKGRTLPNRGVRGRVGGVLDLSMQWAGPNLHSREATLLSDVKWRDGSLYLHGLAPEELEGLELETSATVRWRPDTGVFRVEDGEVKYNGLEATYFGEIVDWPLEPVIEAEVLMPETECQAIIDAVPEKMLGPYKNVTLSGAASPHLIIDYPLNRPHHLEFELDGLAEEDNPEFRRKRRRSGEEPLTPLHKNYYCKITGLKAEREGWPELEMADAPGSVGQEIAKTKPPGWRHPGALGDVYWLNKPFVKRVPEEGVYDEAEIFIGPGLDTYVPLSQMPVWVPGAAYLSEEILFYSNKGVSLGLIEKAVRINLERGRFVYGGSTVTQQLVKNLFLSRDKTLARKLQEALISLRIDEVVSKRRVIELYLNCIEFGPNLYGIGPAAQFYFQKHPRDLTPMEAVFLAIIKPSPSYGAHLKRRGKLPESGWINKRVETIFKRMVEYKVLTQEEADAERPYMLEWDKDGNYIPRKKSPTEQLDDLLKIDLFDP